MDYEVTAKVVELAAQQAGVDPGQVTPESHFVNDLHFDSLDVMDFIMNLEDQFEISVPDDKPETFQLVRQVIEYVEAEKQKVSG